MKTVIVYAHPYEKSFNHAILQAEIERFQNDADDFQVIDLYADKFNPTFSKEGLKLFSLGKTDDPKVEEYQLIIKSADQLEFIFPIWWNDLPAILKGFIDKVFTLHFAYVDTPRVVHGLLTNIKSVKIVTTSKSPTWYLKYFSGNAIKKVFINSTLKQAGINNVKWVNMGQIKKSSSKQREDFLAKF